MSPENGSREYVLRVTLDDVSRKYLQKMSQENISRTCIHNMSPVSVSRIRCSLYFVNPDSTRIIIRITLYEINVWHKMAIFRCDKMNKNGLSGSSSIVALCNEKRRCRGIVWNRSSSINLWISSFRVKDKHFIPIGIETFQLFSCQQLKSFSILVLFRQMQ